MTLWLGQDGFDYGFQADYDAVWRWRSTASARSPSTIPTAMISIEYKPNEPRAYSLLPDAATDAARDPGGRLRRTSASPSTSPTSSMPTSSRPSRRRSSHRHSRLLGVHLNDGYAKRDDGLMVGAVHLQATLELLRQIRRDGYDGALYFDTFPDATGLDPVAECEVNIATVNRLLAVVDRLDGDNRLAEAHRPPGCGRRPRPSSTKRCSRSG